MADTQQRSRLRRPALWSLAASAVAAGLVLTVVAIGGLDRPVEESTGAAQRVLTDVADAQQAVRRADGGYISYWRGGTDHKLEDFGRVRADGVSDVRSIACANGWVAAAVVDDVAYLSSSRQDEVSEATDLTRPDCVSATAVEAMLADFGLPAAGTAPDTSRFTRPAGASQYRPSYHITPEENWMNDPQRPFFLNGLWHYYYLYNADYPDGNGTAWYHLTSTDLQHWEDQGVAIEKYRNGLGDIETGSAVVDYENTAGFGAGAVVAVVTQQDDGIQRQSLFYSTDDGYTFTEYEGNPVLDSPGARDFRDPKIIRDTANEQWVMTLAEGEKIGIYTSQNLTEWTYASSFTAAGLGTLECPDLFQLDLDGDPARRTWVLVAAANGAAEGRTTGTAYWSGTWDGTTFTAADEQHQWLDAGSDFYAAVTWDDPRLTDGQRMGSRRALAWMNNWSYARTLPTGDWSGQNSIIREIRLSLVDGAPTLVSTPDETVDALSGTTLVGDSGTLTASGGVDLPEPRSGAYRLDLTLRRGSGDDGSEARIRIGGEGESVTVGYNFDDEQAFVFRDSTALPSGEGDLGPEYNEVRTAFSPPVNGAVELSIFVDYSSVEVFVNDGHQTLTSLAFLPGGTDTIRAETAGGTLTLVSSRYSPLASIR